MPEVFDFTRLGVSACRESAARRFRRDREPVAVVTRGPAEIAKLGSEPVRFLFMRFLGFHVGHLAVIEHQDFCAHRFSRMLFVGVSVLADAIAGLVATSLPIESTAML